MNKFLLFILFTTLSLTLLSVQVSGNVSGTWSADNNPYQVIGAITVPSGANLEILPGVEVQIMGNFQFTIAGTLQALGTEADSIRFVNMQQPITTLWPGLRFENPSQTSSLQNVYIEYATYAVRCINAPLSVRYCRFNRCEKGMELYAIGATEPNPVTVEYSLIENCIQNAILISQNSEAVVAYNELRYNGTGTQFRAAIQLSNQSTNGSNNPLITHNHIHHNYKQGISAWDVVGASAINPTITNNVIEYNYTGVYFLNASGYCADNQINYNFIPGDMNSGAGVMVSGITSIPYFERNTISHNYAGFYITGNAMPVLGDLDIYHSWAQGENIIRSNIDANGNNNAIFCASYTNAGNFIKAENNYWDYTSTAEINSVIMDHTDNSSLPTIDFDPWLEEVVQPLLTGSYTCGGLPEGAELQLVSAETGLVIASHSVLLNSEFEWVIEPTEPFYAVIRVSEGNRYQIGAAGDIQSPTVFDPASGPQIYLGHIVCSDQMPNSWMRIGNPSIEGGNLVYPVLRGFFIYHWETADYLYQEGDYLMIYKTQYVNPESPAAPLEYIYPEANRTWEKVLNLTNNDSWNKQIISFSADGTPHFTNLTARTYRAWDGYHGIIDWMVSYRNDQNQELYQWMHCANEKRFFTRQISQTGGCFTSASYLVVTEYHSGDDNLFPLVSGISYLMLPQELAYTPTFLVANYDAVEEVPPVFRLFWQPMAYGGESFYSFYRIYRNGVPVATVPAQAGYMIYEEPLPALHDIYTFYVCAASPTEESELSNPVSIYWVANEDPLQLPAGITVYPNPLFASGGLLRIDPATDWGDSRISIYNLRGQLLRTYHPEPDSRQTINWDLLDAQGRACGTGIYFIRMERSGQTLQTKKLMLLK